MDGPVGQWRIDPAMSTVEPRRFGEEHFARPMQEPVGADAVTL